MENKIFALVDCNNFFASCERVFNPALKNKPVVVLSNNDGCVIARSNEAKALGIEMGAPIFKCQDLIRRHHVHVYSSNFVLYGDMSRRVMNTLAQCTPQMEVYSIDEAFLSLDGFKQEGLFDYVRSIRVKVYLNTGLPVSIGVAPTKTLAKIANRIAKKQASTGGVFCLTEEEDINHWLKTIDVGDVWGIGHEKTKDLKRHGIDNAYGLKVADDEWIKKHLSIVSLKTVWELRGISCLPIEEMVPDKKSIATTRSFGREVQTLDELKEAIAAYVSKAAEKLRDQASVCGYLQVFVNSNPFKGQNYYSNSAGVLLSPPTAYTGKLIEAGHRLLEGIYRPEFSYKKAGVFLMNLQPEAVEQGDLFEEAYHNSRRQRLMRTVDAYNRRLANHGGIFMAAEGIIQPWYMNQTHKSKRFTTRWDELLEISI